MDLSATPSWSSSGRTSTLPIPPAAPPVVPALGDATNRSPPGPGEKRTCLVSGTVPKWCAQKPGGIVSQTRSATEASAPGTAPGTTAMPLPCETTEPGNAQYEPGAIASGARGGRASLPTGTATSRTLVASRRPASAAGGSASSLVQEATGSTERKPHTPTLTQALDNLFIGSFFNSLPRKEAPWKKCNLARFLR